MEPQGWKALHQGSPSGSHGSHGDDYNVQSTYFAPESAYVPPDPGYEDPFAPAAPAAGSNPFSGSLVGQEAVPSAAPSSSSQAAHGETVLSFHDSEVPLGGVSGKMGGKRAPTAPEPTGSNFSFSAVTRLLNGGGPNSSDPDGGPDGAGRPQKFGLFNLKRYRKHFDVDTDDVLWRMADSVVGFFRPNFLEKIDDSADLYGPFWISTTLVFVSAVTGNYANYVSYKRQHSSEATGPLTSWYYDVDKVGYSAILFYGYVGILGLLLFAALKWAFKSSVTLPQVWCTYGYSLSIFIPMSFFCVFPLEWLRWALIGAATATSGLFLLLNFRAPIFENAGARALPVWLAMGALHIGLGLALKLYFFQYWS